VSQDFIQFGFPCTDCLVAAACQDKKLIEKKDLLDFPGGIRCLALPVFDTETSSHQKSLLECVANVIWDTACSLNEDRNMQIPEQYRHFLMEYLGIFQYIINTTSWNSNINPVADFDKFEIRRKMKTAMKILDRIGDPRTLDKKE
jgi:hypothetical protein